MKTLKVKFTLIEQVLGTANNNPDVHREFIASKAPNAPSREEEVAAIGVDAVEEKTMTVFPRDEQGRPFWYDYQIKGFFKDSCGSLMRVPGSKSNKLKAYKKIIDGTIFVAPRKILFNGDLNIHQCVRPIVINGPTGQRTALACSEMLEPGVTLEFQIQLLDPASEGLVREWLDYGALRGIGQWRNSSKGRFTWQEMPS
jgi:hypothetical protein